MKNTASRAALAMATALAGCAAVAPQEGYDAVARATKERLGHELRVVRSEADLPSVAEQVAALLRQPLTADAAVRLALINNRGLQAKLAQIGITQAEAAQAGRLANPGFTFSRLTKGDEIEYERSIHFNLARLLTLPLVNQLEQRRYEAVQREVAMDVLMLAADTRRAWVLAVGAEETLRYMRQVFEAAEASAELARRMEQAGNFNKLMRAREQRFYAEAALGVARAEQQQRSARERLTRLLGLWGEQTAFTLPERLPDLPAGPREQPDIERQALAQRLDVQAARLAAEQTARNLGLTRRTRWVNVLEVGYVHNTSNAALVQKGWEIGLELPLFDWGDARVARAEGVYMQALHKAAETAIVARSEVREAYGGYRTAWDVARHHRDELVPLAKRISEEQLLRYNGMLIGVFELLADARAQVASVNAAIEALRDFWLAEADLDQALIGKVVAKAAQAAPMVGAAMPAGAAGGGEAH
jgi:outer membrane protein TolC